MNGNQALFIFFSWEVFDLSFEFLNKSCDIKEQLPFLLVMGRVGVLGEG